MAKTPTVHVNLRLTPDLHRQLVKWAARRQPKHSLNTEIVSRLLKSVGEDSFDLLTPEDQEKVLHRFEVKLEERIAAVVERFKGKKFSE
jgi:hypothetical protein